MKIQIKNYLNNSIIFEADCETTCAAVLAAVKSGANLSGADLKHLVSQRIILPEGDLVGWKKLVGGTICQLRIPVDARRVGGVIGRKCRAEFAEVISGKGFSLHDKNFTYEPGLIVRSDKFDDNPLVECSSGIHFFITRQEAEDYN